MNIRKKQTLHCNYPLLEPSVSALPDAFAHSASWRPDRRRRVVLPAGDRVRPQSQAFGVRLGLEAAARRTESSGSSNGGSGRAGDEDVQEEGWRSQGASREGSTYRLPASARRIPLAGWRCRVKQPSAAQTGREVGPEPVRMEMPTRGRRSGRTGNNRSGRHGCIGRGADAAGQGARRPSGRPPDQGSDPGIAVGPPHTRT